MTKHNTQALLSEMGRILKEKGIKLNAQERKEVVYAMIEGINNLLAETEGEGSVSLSGKYTFVKQYVPAKERLNPATGEKFMDDAKYRITVKPGNGTKNFFKNLPVE